MGEKVQRELAIVRSLEHTAPGDFHRRTGRQSRGVFSSARVKGDSCFDTLEGGTTGLILCC